jgi:hypothetical protein
MAVYEENDGGKEPLTWTQTREDMPLTHRVRRTPPHAAATGKEKNGFRFGVLPPSFFPRPAFIACVTSKISLCLPFENSV